MLDRERAWAVGVSVVLLGAVAWPAIRGKDGFPLSNYPMFSRPREPVARVFHVVGHSVHGAHRPLSPEMIGTDEIMQAYQTVKRAIFGGRAADLCERVAKGVALSHEDADIDRLEVRVDWFDTVNYWAGERKPQRTEVAATCTVPEKDGEGP